MSLNRLKILQFKLFFSRYYSNNHVKRDPLAHIRIKTMPNEIWEENKDPKFTGYEEVKGHWQYVERLIPKLRVPVPTKKVSSTGWKAPDEKLPDHPYHVARTRNHLLPVYEQTETKDQVFTSVVKKINGDIYVFERDLKFYLEKKLGSKIESHVNEICCCVSVKGDKVNEIKEWLYNKGF